jgi:Secretion system C-terminal sorting domain
MKKTLLLIVLYLGVIGGNVLFAQSSLPCNITSTGLELWNETKTALLADNKVAVGADAYARLKIVNAGTASGSCFYAPGKVRVEVPFVAAGLNLHYYKYDDALSFSSAKYDWVYDVTEDLLVGINNVNITAGLFSTEIVDIKIEGVKATPIPTSSISDLTMELSIVNNTTSDYTLDNTHYLRINVGPSGGVLPVTLNEFDAKAENCVSVIKWKTSNETNLSKFEIETSSDGLVFLVAGTVKPSASSSIGQYQFSWNQPTGKAYYRLKMIDNDGSVSYSKIIPITSDCNDKKKFVQLYPNPVNTTQLLKVNITGYDKAIRGDLYSATGQFIKSFILVNGGNNLSVENLSQGFYTLKVSENGTQTEVFKLNVLR